MFAARLRFFVFYISIWPLYGATVVIAPFHNASQVKDADWIGESIAETLRSEVSRAGTIVLSRQTRQDGLSRLSLRSDSSMTKASTIKFGQTVQADIVCYGNYEVNLSSSDAALRDAAIHVKARLLNLQKFRDDIELTESGNLSDLSRIEEHLAWQVASYLNKDKSLDAEQFVAPQKLVHLDAKESYIRGLLTSNLEQRQRWFVQSTKQDPRYINPIIELGNLLLKKRDYRSAVEYLSRVPPADARYAEARFGLGLGAYAVMDFTSSIRYFREVSQKIPLNEVYNNLGAAESRLNLPVAMDDFRRAVDADPSDPVYQFNLGLAMLKSNYFEQAAKQMKTVLEAHPDDRDAQRMLAKAQSREAALPRQGIERLKSNFDATAYLQLKTMLQPNKQN